jgi:hypothetical protein
MHSTSKGVLHSLCLLYQQVTSMRKSNAAPHSLCLTRHEAYQGSKKRSTRHVRSASWVCVERATLFHTHSVSSDMRYIKMAKHTTCTISVMSVHRTSNAVPHSLCLVRHEISRWQNTRRVWSASWVCTGQATLFHTHSVSSDMRYIKMAKHTTCTMSTPARTRKEPRSKISSGPMRLGPRTSLTSFFSSRPQRKSIRISSCA